MLSSRISRISNNVAATLIEHAVPRSPAALFALPQLDIENAAKRLNGIATRTPLQFSRGLSKRYNAQIYLKREDLQVVSIIVIYVYTHTTIIIVTGFAISAGYFLYNVRVQYLNEIDSLDIIL